MSICQNLQMAPQSTESPHIDLWNHLMRFAFCKRDDPLDEAIRRLQVLRR